MAGRESEKIILILLVTVVMVVVVGGFYMMMSGYWAGNGMMGSGMMGQTGMHYGWWMPLGGLIFLVILIAGLYFVFSASKKSEQPHGFLEILKERYAKGEITSEQYDRMKKELET